MPTTITPVTASNFSGSTSTSDTFVDASCTTAALDNGVDYLVLVLSSHSTEGAFPTTSGSEMEARFGTTRYALSSFLGFFANFNSGDSANGGILQAAFLVTGDGSSTVNLRVRRNGGSDTVRWGGAQVIAIPLTALVLDTDYFVAQAANSDTAEVVTTDATWVNGDSGGALTFTAPRSADCLLVYSAEGFISGTPNASGETFRFRARLDSATVGTETEASLDVDNATATVWGPSCFALDVRAVTATTSYTARVQFSNASTGDAGAFRRSRVFAIMLDAFVDYEAITNGGNIVANAEDEDSANALSWNFGTSIGTLILACCNHQNGGAFGQGYLRQSSTNYPTAGYMWAVLNGGTATSDDNSWLSFMRYATLSGAQSAVIRGTSEGASDLTFGNFNSASSRTPVVAIDLTAAAGGSETGDAAISAPVPTIAASGRFVRSGTGAIAAPVPTIAAAGGHEERGPVAISIPVPTMAAAGRFARSGTVAASIPLPVITAAGRFELTGTADISIPIPRIRARETESTVEPGDPGPVTPERIGGARVRGERVRGRRV